MNIGGRSFFQIARAIGRPQHYVALANMIRRYPDFLANTARYLFGIGTYPYDIRIRTPVGIVRPRLYSHHDLLTVNEVFCREDYRAPESLKTVLDCGSNIGLSALYFLTRNRESKCSLYEPDPRNIARLKRNLAGFENRYVLFEAAIGDSAGEVEFGIEQTGRYGGIGLKHQNSIRVTCLHIDEALTRALADAPFIDIVKIDTEGYEIKIVGAIAESLLKSVGAIYLEADPQGNLHPETFINRQYGSVRRLLKRSNLLH